jgi:hypothetical protein
MPTCTPTEGGARLSGKELGSLVSAFLFKCSSIFLITTGSWMQAMTLTAPPHFLASLYVDIEDVFDESPEGAYFWCAQAMAAQRSTGVGSCIS